MPIMLNTIFLEAGFDPQDIRIIRHKDKRAAKGRSPYELWRDDRPKFELYQSTQSFANRKKLMASYWAVFIVNHSDETMFAGLYAANYLGLLKDDLPKPHMDGNDKAGSCDMYKLLLQDKMSELIGKMYIDWGPAALAWIQHADRNNKPIIELHKEIREPDFPGFLNFIKNLSELRKLPTTWIEVLKSSRGIYLLTCPKTKELYVGSASGINGFWGRWEDYIQTGHGGNIKLKSREKSDYQVSILEVAGTSITHNEILLMEKRWKDKLQSKEMGLNSN